MITRDEVLRCLDYDEFTGVFRWKVAHKRVKSGSEAGWVNVQRGGKTYRRVKIKGRTYKVHRLAWLILTGEFPKNEIDHIDGQGLNNAASNLRAVTNAQNAKNHRKQVNNTSGVVGVLLNKATSKWDARIGVDGKQTHLGRFDNFNEAVAVRKEAERIHGYHPRHGEERPL